MKRSPFEQMEQLLKASLDQGKKPEIEVEISGMIFRLDIKNLPKFLVALEKSGKMMDGEKTADEKTMSGGVLQ